MKRAAFVLLLAVGALSAQVEFRPHVIESKMPGGYSLLVVDINHDGKPDVIGMTPRFEEVAWYENPGASAVGASDRPWERHVIAKGLRGLLYVAASDLDGDGIPEIAVLSEFNMVAAKSAGVVSLLVHQGDPRDMWKTIKLDAITTSHHVVWADIEGNGKKVLINSPLIGASALAPKYEGKTPLFFYPVPANLDAPWKRVLIDDQLNGIVHRVRPVKWNPGKRDQLLTTGFDGVILHEPSGSGDNIQWKHTLLVKGHEEEPPKAGTSDVAVGSLKGKRFLAAIEPWHGNEVVVYTPGSKPGEWQRRVIFNELIEGHELCVADFNGDGRDDLAITDRARGEISSPHVFYALDDTGARWHHEVLDFKGMSASGAACADINGDGRPDIVMIGGATANIKWYENLGVKK